MKIAIMQPYLFPYIGYFQLINCVDKFIIYDDVNYIKNGWINRNKIWVNGNEYIFTLPLKNASSFDLINNTSIDAKNYPRWKDKFIKTINSAYQNAPQYKIVLQLIEEVLNEPEELISSISTKSILATSNYLGLKTEIVTSSSIYNNSNLHSQERVIDICLKENADTYINAIGGKELYDSEYFASKNIKLKFIESKKDIQYLQFNNVFVPWLSIIDVLMFNSIEKVKSLLNKYDLIH